MCFYIGIEDLAANALIEILSKNDRRFVSYGELEAYGSEVISILSQKGEKAVLILSRESTNALFRNYSDYFEEKLMDSVQGIGLKENISVDDLEDAFRGYLSLEVLMAFVDEQSIAKLGVCA